MTELLVVQAVLTIARDGERVMLHPISDEAHLFGAYTGDRVVA